MFFVDHVLKDGRLAVADTDDGIIDIISNEEFKEYSKRGIKINYWDEAKSQITSSLNRNCNYKLYRKLQRNCDESELKEYLDKYSIYHIAQKLNEFNTELDLNKMCRLFDYSQTQGYFILVLGLVDDMVMLAIIDEEYNMACTILRGSWHFEKYPSCNGSFLARMINKVGLSYPSLNLDEPYITMYSSDLSVICFISHYTLCNNPIYLNNPERKIIM